MKTIEYYCHVVQNSTRTKRGKFLKTLVLRQWGVLGDNLVFRIGHCRDSVYKEIHAYKTVHVLFRMLFKGVLISKSYGGAQVCDRSTAILSCGTFHFAEQKYDSCYARTKTPSGFQLALLSKCYFGL